MALPATDAFNRADSTTTLGTADTGQTWVARRGTWGILSNTAYVASGATNDDHAVVDTGVTDYYVTALITASPTNVGLVARHSATDTHYLATYDGSNACTLWKVVSGTYTQLGTASDTLAAGDTLGIKCVGSTIQYLRNDVVKITATDSALTGTYVGMRLGATTSASRYDAFSALVPVATLASDAFNRADSAVTMGTADTGQTWTPLSGTWGIVSNTAYGVTAVDGDVTIVDTGVTDGTAYATLTGTSGSTYPCIVGRGTDNNNYYQVVMMAQGQANIYKKVAGTVTQLTTVNDTFANGNTLGIRCSGTTISYLRNGSVITSVTDSSLTTGTKWGLRTGGGASVVRFDDFMMTGTALPLAPLFRARTVAIRRASVI